MNHILLMDNISGKLPRFIICIAHTDASDHGGHLKDYFHHLNFVNFDWEALTKYWMR